MYFVFSIVLSILANTAGNICLFRFQTPLRLYYILFPKLGSFTSAPANKTVNKKDIKDIPIESGIVLHQKDDNQPLKVKSVS